MVVSRKLGHILSEACMYLNQTWRRCDLQTLWKMQILFFFSCLYQHVYRCSSDQSWQSVSFLISKCSRPPEPIEIGGKGAKWEMKSYLSQSLINWHETCCECSQPCPWHTDIMLLWQLCSFGLLGPCIATLLSCFHNSVVRSVIMSGFCSGTIHTHTLLDMNSLQHKDCVFKH